MYRRLVALLLLGCLIGSALAETFNIEGIEVFELEGKTDAQIAAMIGNRAFLSLMPGQRWVCHQKRACSVTGCRKP